MNEWPNEKCLEFVEDYKSFTCLWRTSDPMYTDRKKRELAHRTLALKYGLANRQAVVNKIKCYRSYFHRLYTYMQKKNSNANPDDVPYEPNWFLFKPLRFILEDEEDSPLEEENVVLAPKQNRVGKRNSRPPERYISSAGEKSRPERKILLLSKKKINSDDEVNNAERRNETGRDQDHDDEIGAPEPTRDSNILYPVKIEIEDACEGLQNNEKSGTKASDTRLTLVSQTVDDISGEIEDDEGLPVVESGNGTHVMCQIEVPENEPVGETISLLRSYNPNVKKRDHLSVFGEYVEERIRNLKKRRLQAIAQMRISSVLFELEMSQSASSEDSSDLYPSLNPEEINPL